METFFKYLIFISGMDLQFQWDEVEAFVKQPDGSLFSWCERFHCYYHILYETVSYSLHFLLAVAFWTSFRLRECRRVDFFFTWTRMRLKLISYPIIISKVPMLEELKGWNLFFIEGYIIFTMWQVKQHRKWHNVTIKKNRRVSYKQKIFRTAISICWWALTT